MHFQIFIPGRRGQDPAMLVDVGLADLVAGAEFLDAARGPGGRTEDGVPGVIVAWRKPGAAQMGYQPEKQTWIPASAKGDLEKGRYWVGFWNDSPPRPAHLARPYPQPGSSVTLGDEQTWLLPAAKELNSDLILADDGTWKFEVQRRFHGFYLEYLKWFHFFAAAEPDAEFSFAEAAEFVLQGLQVNYRLPPEVASYLRLFSKESVLAGMFSIQGVRS